MAFVPSSLKPDTRNRVSHSPHRHIKQSANHRNFPPQFDYSIRNNRNRDIKTSELDYSRGRNNSNYDTLDSAYSTSESSYNTVDSSCSHRSHSSGYSTLELTWKEPQRQNILPKNADFVKNPSLHQPGDFLLPGKYFDAEELDYDKIKYVDDADDTDTATETETDTEQTVSGTLDMSYVPDYIRPMLAPVSVSTLTTTTSSFTTSRPIITSTMTSPSVSLTSSAMTSPSGSVKDDTIGSSRPATYKRADRNLSYTGYREDYVKKQKEKLCGRKSLDDRLKSLEFDAAVKLQVCKGSQNRRRKTDERGSSVSRALENRNRLVKSRSKSPTQVKKEQENATSQEVQIEPTPTRAPPPDIIEAHQPPEGVPQESDGNKKDQPINDSNSPLKLIQPVELPDEKELEASFDSKEPVLSSSDWPLPVDTNDEDIVSSEDVKISLSHPVDSSSEVAPSSSSRKSSRDLSDISTDVLNSNQPGFFLVKSEIADDVPAGDHVVEKGIDRPKSPQSFETPVSKLSWNPPSQEAMNRLNESFEKAISTNQNTLPSTELIQSPKLEDVPEVPKPVVRRDGAIQRRGAPAALIFDVTTDTAVVPVELRSPRGEGGGPGRENMREKRNARMFVLPSSDDSENDNLLYKLNQSVEKKPIHVAPVKFVPSVLRRSKSRSAKDDVSHSSSSSSVAADIKTTSVANNNNTPTSPLKESKRKSSRSPKRSNSKRSNRSKSAHDHRPPPDKVRHTRTQSNGSHSPVSVSSGNDVYSTRTPDKDSRSQRPKEKLNRTSSSHTRHKTEYSELSNTKRTPRSNRKHVEATSLSSPRQQAVAHAVKFGFSNNEGTIPYIDDVTSPVETQKPAIESMRDRAATDSALLHDANSATIRHAFPLSRRGRSLRKKDTPRRTSYMEAMESSEDLTPDPDTDGSNYSICKNNDDQDRYGTLGLYGRSNSADSILSTTEAPTKVVLRKHARSSSADRNSLKHVHRRSYQIATTKPVDSALLRTPSHKRQPSIRKLKNFFVENTPQTVEAQGDEGRRGSRGRSLGLVPTLQLSEYDDTVVREGFLYFKVATIEKGKRTSAQKSWKVVWVVLKDQSLYLCKDWSRNKQDSSGAPGGTPVHNSPNPTQPPPQLILEEEEPLNIHRSLVSIAYNYVKRKNVFKVTTCNGSEYLFQAEDRDDMLAWISSIQVSGNHDNKDGEVTVNEDLILRKTNQIEAGRMSLTKSPLLPKKFLPSPKPDKRGTRKSRSPKSVRRMTVPIKDMDGSRRFKWRGSVNRIVRKFGQGQTLMQGGTFEVHLEDCPPSPNNELIPFVVELCCRIVEERGLSFTGIYRVPGNNGTLAALQDELNCRGADAVDLENDERFCELNVVSSLLKSFFRKLPDPLFTNELYDDFITMNRKQDPEERLNGLRRLIHMLPAPHYETLKFLIQHLRKIADNSEVNKMEVRNLAIVFGPTLVRSTISDNMATMVTDMSDQCRIVESVLQHAAWFFTEDEDQEDSDQIRPVPSEHHHEPVPNIDHLLANVGRTPGDVSDSTSESSKSKNSCTSEKESFSRDVMEMIFGAKKRWLQNPQRGGGKENAEESSDDEYGFKEAERNQARAVVERFQSPPKSPLTTSTTTTKYQVAKPAATGIRAGWPGKAQHLPSDIPARLYDFYIENLERLARTDPSRPLPYFSSSSTDTSPQVTPRSSQFEPHQPSVQRSYALQPRRCSDSKPPNGGAPSPPEATRQLSVPTSSPPQQYNPRAFDEPLRNQTNKMNQHVTMSIGNPLQSGKEIRSRLVPVQNQPGFNNISKEPCHSGEESDSDTSIYVGDTLEEKLKNLTNLDKKLERRPSRRVANRPPDMLIRVQPPAPIHPLNTSNKLLTAPSLKAGEIITPDNLHMYPSKKTTRELYQERKAQRQQHREFVKSKRSNRKESDLTRCASDENVFSRGDPKRQMIRSAACDDVSSVPPRRLRSSKEKVKRRHTLSGSDFPGQEFWDKSIYSSLQNIPRYAPGSAMARLRPQMGPASAVNNRLSVPRLPNYGANHISEKNRRTESYL